MEYNINQINNLLKAACLILKQGDDELRKQIRRKLKLKFLNEIQDLFYNMVDINGPGLGRIQGIAQDCLVFKLDDDIGNKILDHITKSFTSAYGKIINIHLEYINQNLVSSDTLKKLKDMLLSIQILLTRLKDIDQEVEQYLDNLVESDWLAPDIEHHYGI